jgi:hypothetical protein
MATRKYVDASKVSRNLQRIATGLPMAVRDRWLKQTAAAIAAEAKRRCPVEKGDLSRSIGFRVVGNTAIIYATMEYAAAQHENLQFHHDVGQAKYLEQPLMEIGLGEAPQQLRDALLRELGGLL